jgi:hypothetical protein
MKIINVRELTDIRTCSPINSHIEDTVLVFVITKCSGFKSAGYKNRTRSFKIVYLKVDFWTHYNTVTQNADNISQQQQKNHVQGKVLQSVLKI